MIRLQEALQRGMLAHVLGRMLEDEQDAFGARWRPLDGLQHALLKACPFVVR